MDINKYVLAILLLTSLFLMKFTCKKLEIDCTQVKYNFQLPVKAYPNKDSINIGDTLWLEINESVTFKNTNSSIIMVVLKTLAQLLDSNCIIHLLRIGLMQ